MDKAGNPVILIIIIVEQETQNSLKYIFMKTRIGTVI
jgi:hypothetical protein